jgi:hypothetical protein
MPWTSSKTWFSGDMYEDLSKLNKRAEEMYFRLVDTSNNEPKIYYIDSLSVIMVTKEALPDNLENIHEWTTIDLDTGKSIFMRADQEGVNDMLEYIYKRRYIPTNRNEDDNG